MERLRGLDQGKRSTVAGAAVVRGERRRRRAAGSGEIGHDIAQLALEIDAARQAALVGAGTVRGEEGVAHEGVERRLAELRRALGRERDADAWRDLAADRVDVERAAEARSAAA